MEGYCRSDSAFHIDAFHVHEIKAEEDEGMFVLIRGFNNIHTTPVLTRTTTPRVVPFLPVSCAITYNILAKES